MSEVNREVNPVTPDTNPAEQKIDTDLLYGEATKNSSESIPNNERSLGELFINKFRKGARYLAVLALLKLGSSVVENIRAADLEGEKGKETVSMQVIEYKFLEKEFGAEKMLFYIKADEVLSRIKNFKEDATPDEISGLRSDVRSAKRSAENHFDNLKEISEEINKNPQTSDEYKNQINRVLHFLNKILAIIDDIAEKMERIPRISFESVRKSAYNASVILGIHEGEGFLAFYRERAKKITDNQENVDHDQEYLKREFERENWEANKNIINILEEVGKRSIHGKAEQYLDEKGNLKFDYRTPGRREAVHSYELRMEESLKRLESILKKLNEYDNGDNIKFQSDLNILKDKIVIANRALEMFKDRNIREDKVYDAGEDAIRDIRRLDNKSRLPINPADEANMEEIERMFKRVYLRVVEDTRFILEKLKKYPSSGSYNQREYPKLVPQYKEDVIKSLHRLQDILDRVRRIPGGDKIYSEILIPFSGACRIFHLALGVTEAPFRAGGERNLAEISEKAIADFKKILNND